MFWQCCRRSDGQENTKNQNKNGSREAYGMDIRISTVSNESQNSNTNHSNGSVPVPVPVPVPASTKEERVRTHSSSSIKSSESFYSVKSSAPSAGGEGDFYSICSVDSYKST